MFDILIGLALVMMLGVAFCFFIAARSPIGYEDETGFHYGPDHLPAYPVPEEFPGAVAHLGR